ncbi:glycoside hydrolase family 5 protein [Tenggerimyces flavus]|uniref:Glycoside hydrolase family 5 protein n=1 Tax=Tenggerimyces flavus TaxID=1708749 RepID=A0ABV7YN49_9ACTN|nr:glycoside hydrolase family 5 protein [Tenggerimyces flavus]MBM7784671.1 endoglucanase [Tenggerimyces flavus]
MRDLSAWRGINFGGALDGGRDWILDHHLDVVVEAGFNLVRLPVRWSPRRPEFARVDEVVRGALSRGLDVVVTVHHYDELSADVALHRADFLALWGSLAEHFAPFSPKLHLALLNEPHEPMTSSQWNELLAEALAVVRSSNPDRLVLVGPMLWNTFEALPTLSVPDDENVAVTVHYYSPFQFTHQGAPWLPAELVTPARSWGSEDDYATVRADFARAASWGRPLFLGEFGVLNTVDLPTRARWLTHVRSLAEEYGMGWASWDFGTDFGAYDLTADRWRPELLTALLPQ